MLNLLLWFSKSNQKDYDKNGLKTGDFKAVFSRE